MSYPRDWAAPFQCPIFQLLYVFKCPVLAVSRTEPAAPRNRAHVVFWPIRQIGTYMQIIWYYN
jgi:hypothetical protein